VWWAAVVIVKLFFVPDHAIAVEVGLPAKITSESNYPADPRGQPCSVANELRDGGIRPTQI